MLRTLLLSLLLLEFSLATAQTGGAASALSEQDFLADMPIVLSVSRLAQRLDETPGAMTILDRDFIRRTGARDVTDVLRLVPGFQTTTSFETDAPMATYHGRSNDWANRIQVLVDGRSVYSGFLMGSAGLGWQTLALEDIERIEVLRGSNSATYGARAFLGVVNIISRDVRDTKGASGKVTVGDNGVVDLGASLGWGNDEGMHRLSLDSRGDQGLRGAFGENRVGRVNVSSHLALGAGDDVYVRAGAAEIAAGRGNPQDFEGNRARTRFMSSQFLQLDWQRSLNQDQDIAVSVSHTEYQNNDAFPYLSNNFGAAYFGTTIAFRAREYNDVLSVQHTVRLSPVLRTVWGTELRREQIVSRTNFDVREQVNSHFYRVFGSAEWRMSESAVLNLGGMSENSDLGGTTFSPRVMLNWTATPGHTLRAGVSSAFRPPSAAERYGDIKYYDVNGANPLTYGKPSPQVRPEKIEVQELGYYLNVPRLGLSGDVRVFRERIVDGIGVDINVPVSYGNGDNYTINGAEYQVGWKPSVDTQLFFNQTWTDIRIDSQAFPNASVSDLRDNAFRITHGAPKYAASVTVMHTLPGGLSVSLMHQRAEEFALSSDTQHLFSMGRTDVRFAKPFRVGRSKAELAFTLQNLDVPYRDGDKKFWYDRRAMVTLRFEN